jgi:cAMP-dependent protein kinase regulator
MLDRALTHSLQGEHEAALAWAAGRVRAGGVDRTSLFLVGRELVALGQRDTGVVALRTAARFALHVGNLPLAAAACAELRAMGEEASAELDGIAKSFSRGSSRLVPRGAMPPSLPSPGREATPLDGDVIGDAEALVLTAARDADALDKAGPPPGVTPQPLFSALDAEGLRAMLNVFDVEVYDGGGVLIRQGTTGNEAFVVVRGELDVVRKNKDGSSLRLAQLGPGALLGEMALLSRAPRTANVIARRPSIVLVAREEALDAVAAKTPQVGHEFAAHCRGRMVTNLMRTSPIFSAIEASERMSLMYRFVSRTFEPGQKIIVQGEENDGLHLIASGEVDVRLHDETGEVTRLAELGVGEVVGEMGLVLRRPASADVVARTPTVTLHLPRDGFLDLVKEHPTVLTQLYEIAVKRDQETSSIVAQEATNADDFVFL